MTDLPPEVRDKAAEAVRETIERGLSNYAVVDAVTEVLAEHDIGVALLTANEGFSQAQTRIALAAGVTPPYSVDRIVERIEDLKADPAVYAAQLAEMGASDEDIDAAVADLKGQS